MSAISQADRQAAQARLQSKRDDPGYVPVSVRAEQTAEKLRAANVFKLSAAIRLPDTSYVYRVFDDPYQFGVWLAQQEDAARYGR